MIGRLVSAVLLLVLFASYAAAQDTSSDGADFCATAPQELLVALDGGWNLTQGLGTGTGRTDDGAIAFPLPAQAPVGVTLTYDPGIRGAIMRVDGQQMLMMPTMTETAAQVLGPGFEDLVGSAASGAACDWYALPTVVGTLTYSLSGGASPEWAELLELDTGSGYPIFRLCLDGVRFDAFVAGEYWSFIGSDGFVGNLPSDLPDEAFEDFQPASSLECEQIMDPVQGELKMTFAAKFDSPSSGRGRVVYDGELDGAEFTVVAPVEMAR